MSKRRRPPGPSSDQAHRPSPENREASSAPRGVRPFKPRRTLFAVLGVILIAWLAVLLLMYFKTVYPQRHGPHKTHANPPVAPIPRGQ